MDEIILRRVVHVTFLKCIFKFKYIIITLVPWTSCTNRKPLQNKRNRKHSVDVKEGPGGFRKQTAVIQCFTAMKAYWIKVPNNIVVKHLVNGLFGTLTTSQQSSERKRWRGWRVQERRCSYYGMSGNVLNWKWLGLSWKPIKSGFFEEKVQLSLIIPLAAVLSSGWRDQKRKGFVRAGPPCAAAAQLSSSPQQKCTSSLWFCSDWWFFICHLVCGGQCKAPFFPPYALPVSVCICIKLWITTKAWMMCWRLQTLHLLDITVKTHSPTSMLKF